MTQNESFPPAILSPHTPRFGLASASAAVIEGRTLEQVAGNCGRPMIVPQPSAPPYEPSPRVPGQPRRKESGEMGDRVPGQLRRKESGEMAFRVPGQLIRKQSEVVSERDLDRALHYRK